MIATLIIMACIIIAGIISLFISTPVIIIGLAIACDILALILFAKLIKWIFTKK